MSRQRTKPRPDRPISLTERDVRLLTLLGTMRLCTTTQIAREFFPSHNRARQRLRRLYDAGLVTRFLIDSRKDDLYGVTPRGKDILRSAHPALVPSIRVARTGPALGTLEHQIALVDARLYLSALAQSSDGLELLRVETGRGPLAADLRELGLVPDALAQLQFRATDFILAIEVDTGSEPVRTLNSKWNRYERAAAAGSVQELWVISTQPPASRFRGLRSTPLTRLFDGCHLNQRPVLPPPARVS